MKYTFVSFLIFYSSLNVSIYAIKAADFFMGEQDGKRIFLKDFKGKFIHLDFSESWCSPCRKQAAYLHKVEEKLKKYNFVSITLLKGEKKIKLIEWRKKYHLNYVLNDAGYGSLLFPINGLPTNYLIDNNFNIVASWSGALSSASSFIAKVKTSMSEMFITKSKKELTQILFYSSNNFNGTKKVVTKSYPKLVKPIAIKSIKLSKGKAIILFSKSHYKGKSYIVTKGIRDIDSIPNVPWKVRSIFILTTE